MTNIRVVESAIRESRALLSSLGNSKTRAGTAASAHWWAMRATMAPIAAH